MCAASGGKRAGGAGANGNGGSEAEDVELVRNLEGESTEVRCCAAERPATDVALTSDGGGPGGRWLLVAVAEVLAFCTPVTWTSSSSSVKSITEPLGLAG